jgi:cyclopropane fatty-acyl-phospholipid synthase-like methyltransferase
LGLQDSPAAERNKQPIAGQLAGLLPRTGRVLEIASGTGQHALHFAGLMPGIHWQPSDPGEDERLAIEARRAATGLANVAPALAIDVLEGNWPADHDFDAIVCINMIHISAPETTPALFAGAARHLSRTGPGLVVLYGPFREDGLHTAPSNAQFEQWLQSRDPRFGVRNLQDVEALATEHGFNRIRLARLPANNLLVAFARSI